VTIKKTPEEDMLTIFHQRKLSWIRVRLGMAYKNHNAKTKN